MNVPNNLERTILNLAGADIADGRGVYDEESKTDHFEGIIEHDYRRYRVIVDWPDDAETHELGDWSIELQQTKAEFEAERYAEEDAE